MSTMSKKSALIKSVKTKRRIPAVSFVLSLSAIGLGQIYNGNLLSGIVFFMLRLVILMLIPFTVLVRDSPSHLPDFFVLSAAAVVVSAASPLEALMRSLKVEDAPRARYNRVWFYIAYSVFATFLSASALWGVVSFFSITAVGSNDSLPSLVKGERVLVMTYVPGEYRRGDLVLTGDGAYKRVIALPKCDASYDGAVFRVKGTPLTFGIIDPGRSIRYSETPQEYLLEERADGQKYPIGATLSKRPGPPETFRLGADQYLLAGDNRTASAVPVVADRRQIKGRVEGVIFPSRPIRFLLEPRTGG